MVFKTQRFPRSLLENVEFEAEVRGAGAGGVTAEFPETAGGDGKRAADGVHLRAVAIAKVELALQRQVMIGGVSDGDDDVKEVALI